MATFIKETSKPPATIDVKVIGYHDYCPVKSVVGSQSRRLASQAATGAKGNTVSSGDADTSCRVKPSKNQSNVPAYYLINGDSFSWEEAWSLSTLVICEEIPTPEEGGESLTTATTSRKSRPQGPSGGGPASNIPNKKSPLRKYAVLRPKALWGPKSEDEFASDKKFAGL